MQNVYIDSKAFVEENVTIGGGTKIWINSQIRKNAVIGDFCNIGKDTFIDEGVKIGSRVKIQNGVSIYHGVTVEEDVFIGPNAAFTNDMYPRAFNEDWQVSDTLVKRGASIGANATIVCGVVLGEYCMVGAGSVVTKDVPCHALVLGNPAQIVGYVCECGNRLTEAGTCSKCNKKYVPQKV